MRLSEELPGAVATDSGPWKLVRHTLPVHLPCALVVIGAMRNGQQATDSLCSQVVDIYLGNGRNTPERDQNQAGVQPSMSRQGKENDMVIRCYTGGNSWGYSC